MTDIATALAHLDAARRALALEAYGEDGAPISNITISTDLERIDRAIGPKGESIFARLADSIDEAYIEIVAAVRALRDEK